MCTKPRGRMGKRRRTPLSEEDDEPTQSTPARSKKKSKLGEDALEKLLSLLSTEGSQIAGLTFLLTTIKHEKSLESMVTKPLLPQYLEKLPECEQLLVPLGWNREKRTVDIMLLCFEVLEEVLLFTSSGQSTTLLLPASTVPYHIMGVKLTQTLIANHMRIFYSSLVTTVPMRLVAACLRVLVAMVMQGVESARELQQVFNFAYKPLEVFPNRTNPIQGKVESVRMCFMNFALSFLVIGDNDIIKATLETKGFLSSLFKLLPKDSPETIQLFLTTLNHRVVHNATLPKRIKSQFFNTYVLKQISQLLTTPTTSGDSTELQEYTHQLLIKLCTDFQLGICYKSKQPPQGLQKTTNPVILHLLLSLTGALPHPLVQSLVLNTLTACHDLVIPYLSAMTLNFDPQPSTKWVSNIELITKLFSLLPSVRALLCAESADKQLPLTYLDVGVELTVPMVISRSGLSHGVQHPLALVKYQTLSLMRVVLRRAAETSGRAVLGRSLDTIESFPVRYTDRVLKCLPDIKTLISLHQQLSGDVVTTSGPNTDKLDHSHQLRNSELQESPDLLSLWLEVLRGYQTLSPTIFLQAGYNLTKLLPSEGDEGIPPVILVSTLQLITEAPVGSVKLSQKGGSALECVLSLINSSPDKVASSATTLAHKLLVSMELFKGSDCEVDLLLRTLRECHARSVVEWMGGAILEATKNEMMLTNAKMNGSVLLEERNDEMELLSSAVDQISLEDLLAAPLTIPDGPLSCDNHTIIQNHKRVFPLLPTLLTSQNDDLEWFKDSFLRKLLLVDPSIAPHISSHNFLPATDWPTETDSVLTRLANCVHIGEDGVVVMVMDSKIKDQIIESWKELDIESTEFKSSIKAVVNHLWQLYNNSAGDTSLVKFLFQLLSEAVSMLSDASSNEVPLEIFESRLFKEAFLPSGVQQSWKSLVKKKRRVKSSTPELFCHRIGQLLALGLDKLPALRESSGLQATRDKLFVVILDYLRHPGSFEGKLLCDLLKYLKATIDSSTAASFIESIFVTHKTIHLDAVPFLAAILKTLLNPIDPCEDNQRVIDPSTSYCDTGSMESISEQAMEGLVKLAIRSEGSSLNDVLHCVLKQQIHCKGLESVNSPKSFHPESKYTDSVTTGVDSVLTALLSHCTMSSQESTSLPSYSSLSMTQLLVTPSDILVTNKLDQIYSMLATSCAHNVRVQRILESLPAQLQTISVSKPSPLKTISLSTKTQKQLLTHCVHYLSSSSPDIVSFLMQEGDCLIEHFEAKLLSTICQRLSCTDKEMNSALSVENEQLYLLQVCQYYLEHSDWTTEGRQDKGVVKTAIKMLWRVCSDLITSSNCPETLAVCTETLLVLSHQLPKGMKKIEKLFNKWTKGARSLLPAQLSLALQLPLHISCLQTIVLEQSLQTLNQLLQKRGEGQQRVAKLLEETTHFVQGYQHFEEDGGLNPSTLSQFIYAALKHRFMCPSTLRLLTHLLNLPSGRGIDIETLYERVWSHSKFVAVMCQSHDKDDVESNENVKECLIELLVTMVEALPLLGNSSQVPLLLGAYSATRSKSDRGILYLLYKYEDASVSLDKFRPLLWGPAALEQYKQRQEVSWLLWKQPGIQEVIGLLNKELLIQSMNNFPLTVKLQPVNPFSDVSDLDDQAELYDPCFLFPLLTQQLDPSNLVDCRRFIEAGCLGYLISGLGSEAEDIRSLGGHGLELFMSHLEGSRFRERTQVTLLLEVLKNSLSEKDVRLPSVFTAFFSTVASLLLHPESLLYSVVSHFLVYKPALDLGEIPLLMTMLQSSSIEHKLERVWILQLLVNGLRINEDYSLYRRKRVFDHCLSLLSTGMCGKRDQILILELVLRGVAIPNCAVDLVVNKGLITSLEFIQTLSFL